MMRSPSPSRGVVADGGGLVARAVAYEEVGPRLGNFMRSQRTEMAVIKAIKIVVKQGIRIYTTSDSFP